MAVSRPNLLVIMSDDQGPWALGCAGNPEIRTPHLDRLAAEGLRFTNFHCASPVCSPARASFLTGCMPSVHGIQDWLRSGNITVADGVTWSGADRPIDYLRGLTGYTRVLADGGYQCGLSGKWHLGDSARPQQGYQWWYAYALGGDNYHNWLAFDNSPDLVRHPEYITDYYTDRALDFLAAYGGGAQPWCLSVNYTAPHSPWGREQHPTEVYDSYADCPFDSVPCEPPHPWGGWHVTADARQATLQGYFAAVTAMDTQIGRLLDHLDRTGQRERTLVVFTSDNGMSMGHHGICGKGNGTFPFNMYDSAVKVPFLASQPGTVPAGRVCDGLHSHYDWFPTVLEYVGLESPPPGRRPGRSFAAQLAGQDDAGHEAVVVCDEYGPVRMIRDRRWKYVHRYPYGPHELYDLAADPDERQNLVARPEHQPELERLRAGLGEWFDRYADPALDGAREGVTGLGQIDEAGLRGQGRLAWWPRP